MDDMRRKKKKETEKASTKEDRARVVDLNGMSLDSLPKFSIDLAFIRNLNLSNNNLQVRSSQIEIKIRKIDYKY